MIRLRRSLRPVARRAVLLVGLLALTATLAGALHVRQVKVRGCCRFAPAEVETVLRTALGTPTIAARPEELRGAVRALPWVEDAHVTVSLDGVVTCTVTERTPVAVAEDHGERRLVDGEGRFLGPATDPTPPLLLVGFAPFAEERQALLRAVPAFEAAWGEKLEKAVRLGPSDVALSFAGAPCPVLADPAAPERVAAARQVLLAWTAGAGAPPRRLDARIPSRVAVLPAPQPSADGAP